MTYEEARRALRWVELALRWLEGEARALPAVAGSETSREAADSWTMEDTNALRARVYAAIAARGAFGATDEELQVALGMNPSTQRPRRVELEDRGRVRDSGARRLTRSGRRAVVWVVCDDAPRDAHTARCPLCGARARVRITHEGADDADEPPEEGPGWP